MKSIKLLLPASATTATVLFCFWSVSDKDVTKLPRQTTALLARRTKSVPCHLQSSDWPKTCSNERLSQLKLPTFVNATHGNGRQE